ncbi:predicted protein [Chaetomium globosum CBS 148.51]|uniref:Uncharacterized protein n=1 Tax=Chaetomium globosum (strain ATCC 6205 / CBS 148.51 / DSM 1962 / NBRC 6347 / NRRL 1970) TaxID=306901 RepID=Q2H6P9_CHAGB|nr:uncharacterized protein CHGG_05666 [Chaetomium globosum CBS 148.51]EAQ89047.1 predicted protein [Chaetomium globosum CBS 148.51]
MKRASVSLLVADASASRWVHYFDPFYDDDLVEQPVGQVNLYLSDFIDFTGLPAESCLEFHRPSKADLDAGVSRRAQITLTYERLASIFRTARSRQDSATFPIADGDTAEHSIKRITRDSREIAKERIKLAEERIKLTEVRARMVQAHFVISSMLALLVLMLA